MVDENSAGVIVVSGNDKYVTLLETATGEVISRFSCGEIVTSMAFSNNYRHLIAATTDGILYFWRLPEMLTRSLVKLRDD